MIASLSGRLADKSPQAVVVDVGGVGYEVFIPLSAFPKLPDLGKPVTFHTYTHVREDALQLYGFLQREERDSFVRLLSVSGVGPKLALSILSGLPPADLARAVEMEDAARLSKIPGVGAKTAGRVILDLKGKLVFTGHSASKTVSGEEIFVEDAVSALTNLGYPRPMARDTVLRIFRENPERSLTLEEIIRDTLKILVK